MRPENIYDLSFEIDQQFRKRLCPAGFVRKGDLIAPSQWVMIDLQKRVGEFFYLLRVDCSGSLNLKLLILRTILALLAIT